MALPTEEYFASRELSFDELDEISAGGFFGNLWHKVEHGLKSFFTNPVVAGVAAGIIFVGAIVTGGNALKQN